MVPSTASVAAGAGMPTSSGVGEGVGMQAPGEGLDGVDVADAFVHGGVQDGHHPLVPRGGCVRQDPHEKGGLFLR